MAERITFRNRFSGCTFTVIGEEAAARMHSPWVRLSADPQGTKANAE